MCIAVAASAAAADHVGVRAVDNDGNTIDHPDVDAAATNAGTAADDRPHHTAAASAGPDDAAEVPDDVPAAALDDTV